MKLQNRVVLTMGVFSILTAQQGFAAGSKKATSGDPPLQIGTGIPPSSIVRFLMSERGRQIVSHSENFDPQRYPDFFGMPKVRPTTTHTFAPAEEQSAVGPVANAASCPDGFGPRYNLENRQDAVPQNTESIDFFPAGGIAGNDLVVTAANDFRGFIHHSSNSGWGNGETGYYVSRNGSCGVDFEGGLPPFIDSGDVFEGGGSPAVAVDPRIGRNAAFIADQRYADGRSAIALFRTSQDLLKATGACPDGLHNSDQAAICWPLHKIVAETNGCWLDKPHIAVDTRANAAGLGAGDVYVTFTEFCGCDSYVYVVACKNDLTACSSWVQVSADGEYDAGLSHVAVRPDGSFGITYVNEGSLVARMGGGGVDIKYVACTPNGAPNAPTCAAPDLVRTETRPLWPGGRLANQDFDIVTYPKHDVRVDANGTETYVVWDRCAVDSFDGGVCPRAELAMSVSTNNGDSWTAPVVVAPQPTVDQFFPWVKTDRSNNNLAVTYLSALPDATFNHRLQVQVGVIRPGSSVPDALSTPVTLTTLRNEPAADPVIGGLDIGDYIGVTARGIPGGSRTYSAYTYNIVQGTYNTVGVGEQNNHVSSSTFAPTGGPTFSEAWGE